MSDQEESDNRQDEPEESKKKSEQKSGSFDHLLKKALYPKVEAVLKRMARTLDSYGITPNQVTLAWQTGTEVDNAGFNLWRSETEGGPYTKLNDTLIAAQGDPVYSSYYRLIKKFD